MLLQAGFASSRRACSCSCCSRCCCCCTVQRWSGEAEQESSAAACREHKEVGGAPNQPCSLASSHARRFPFNSFVLRAVIGIIFPAYHFHFSRKLHFFASAVKLQRVQGLTRRKQALFCLKKQTLGLAGLFCKQSLGSSLMWGRWMHMSLSGFSSPFPSCYSLSSSCFCSSRLG